MLASLLFFVASGHDLGLQEEVPSPVLLLNAWDCETLADLRAWREHRLSEITKYVPKNFQESSITAMQNEFDERTAQLSESTSAAAGAVTGSVIIAEEPPKKALPIFLASEGNYNSVHELSDWRARQEHRIYDLVPDDYLEIAQGSLAREYDKRVGATTHEGRLPALLFLPSAKSVISIDELQSWRSEQATRVHAFVPEEYRPTALTSIDREYAKHLDRLRLGEVPLPDISALTASQASSKHESPTAELPPVEEVLVEQKPANGAHWAVFGAAVCTAAAGFAVMAAKRRRGNDGDEEAQGYIMVA